MKRTRLFHQTLFLTLSLTLAAVGGNAAVTVFRDRTTFNNATGATRTIDFSTTDSGSPITNPGSDVGFAYLGLSGVCFQSVQSYYNVMIYTFPAAVIRVNLPRGTYAMGADLGHFYPVAGTFTITLSTGDTYNVPYEPASQYPWPYLFFGFVSDTPISWATFSLDNTYLTMDNFSLTQSAGSVPGCPPPADSLGPITSNVIAAPSPVAINTGVTLAATVDDATTGGSNIASAEYSISGGSFSPMTGSFNTSPTVNVTASIPAFAASNLYTLCARGTDAAGNIGATACVLLPVYDPSAGFVTGGGTIYSTAGADYVNPSAAGTASFGFVSKYHNGASTPSGNLEFQFRAGNLNFKSTSMDWLVVTGQPRAQFHGTGTINGTSVCKFQVDAWDGSFQPGNADAFGLKIFACNSGGDANGSRYTIDAVPLASGSIIVH